ncbi:MAG: Ni/Fe hydrogenase [Alphaproteobacteria bacterium]|jgi:urease accessory protein|nr:Ni/Fe hydrogenase [Alphaproteobacteria bacterium]
MQGEGEAVSRSFQASRWAVLLAVAGLGGWLPAFAHSTAEGFQGGFVSGFTHPLDGWDHVAAMVAVGIWGAFLRQPAIWVLPIVFPVVMALGGALGVLGVPVPLIEPGIAASSMVIGLAILAAWRAPLGSAGLIVGLFAVFHGHAHGAELPHAANPVAYSIGFVISTGLLHLAGIAFGLVVDRPGGRIALRGAGGVIAALGVAFLFGLL